MTCIHLYTGAQGSLYEGSMVGEQSAASSVSMPVSNSEQIFLFIDNS